MLEAKAPHRDAEGVEDGYKASPGDLLSKLHWGSGLGGGLQWDLQPAIQILSQIPTNWTPIWLYKLFFQDWHSLFSTKPIGQLHLSTALIVQL